MDRRRFLVAGAALPFMAANPDGATAQVASDVTIELEIRDTTVEMIDGLPLRMLGFQLSRYACRSGSSSVSAGCGRPWVPGPVLRVQDGQQVNVVVRNFRPEPHGFEITGVTGSRIAVPGRTGNLPGTGTASFRAPACGTYLYHDASYGSGRHPLYRLLGLHGAFIVQPDYAVLRTRAEPVTPYGTGASDAMKSLFRTLADPAPFLRDFPQLRGVYYPGAWQPVEDLFTENGPQEKVWIVSQIDPRLHELITDSGIRDSNLTADIAETFLPRYFTLNGRSGFDLVEGEDVVPKNRIGRPTLLRTLNAGLAHHAMHIHGNHIYELAEAELFLETRTPGAVTGSPTTRRTAAVSNVPYSRAIDSGAVAVRPTVYERDVWPMYPMQRKDVLLPFHVPPDIPAGQFEDMATRNVTVEHGTEYDNRREPFPLRYPVHCHCEMSQTAAGGNYPQGLVTHWEITGGPETRTSAATPATTRG